MNDIIGIAIKENVSKSTINLGFFATTPNLPKDSRMLPLERCSMVSSMAITARVIKRPITAKTLNTPRHDVNLNNKAPKTGATIGATIVIEVTRAKIDKRFLPE